jgi:hypothetical protein
LRRGGGRPKPEAVQAALLAPIAVAAVVWLWFLARGRTRGPVKRAALRMLRNLRDSTCPRCGQAEGPRA